MQVTDAIRHMVEGSGQTHREIAEKMGKGAAYISAIISRRTDPSSGTLSEIAKACGYRLELVKGRERIPIEPNDRG